MSEKAEKLKAALAELSLEEREDIRIYLDSLGDEELTQEEWEQAWSEEINRRIADDEAGLTKMIPGEEVMRRLREKYA
ncbi:MAG TPA: addiction module protein [Urbifossiella sp.]|nr:addiction module protein [Urbifossiella sp.]